MSSGQALGLDEKITRYSDRFHLSEDDYLRVGNHLRYSLSVAEREKAGRTDLSLHIHNMQFMISNMRAMQEEDFGTLKHSSIMLSDLPYGLYTLESDGAYGLWNICNRAMKPFTIDAYEISDKYGYLLTDGTKYYAISQNVDIATKLTEYLQDKGLELK